MSRRTSLKWGLVITALAAGGEGARQLLKTDLQRSTAKFETDSSLLLEEFDVWTSSEGAEPVIGIEQIKGVVSALIVGDTESLNKFTIGSLGDEQDGICTSDVVVVLDPKKEELIPWGAILFEPMGDSPIEVERIVIDNGVDQARSLSYTRFKGLSIELKSELVRRGEEDFWTVLIKEATLLTNIDLSDYVENIPENTLIPFGHFVSRVAIDLFRAIGGRILDSGGQELQIQDEDIRKIGFSRNFTAMSINTESGFSVPSYGASVLDILTYLPVLPKFATDMYVKRSNEAIYGNNDLDPLLRTMITRGYLVRSGEKYIWSKAQDEDEFHLRLQDMVNTGINTGLVYGGLK
ncbi:MAG TPA: hypothetical protein ENI23_15825 [bacterium]|nr:hypothetical protein [bacterium]